MTTPGWAIKVSYTNYQGAPRTLLLGRHYFCDAAPRPFGGYTTAVFKTRQLAREAARVAGRGYDHATAVRVLVYVAEAMG